MNHTKLLNEYHSLQTVNECIHASREKPCFILKHSSTCPVSTYAKREVDAYIQKGVYVIYLVVVQQNRPLSNEIANTFGIKHESPQLLLIDHGQVKQVWNHGDITQMNIEEVVS